MKDQFKKLCFIVQELELALFLTNKAPDDFSRRSLARHILIRAKDFINHVRQLRKPLIAAGYNVKTFHEQKEFYANSFDEYFQVSRDKISGHVQDIDFHERIEHWNQIEVAKIGFLVESALQIYRDTLGTMGIPDYEPYQSLPDFTKASLCQVLDEFAKSKVADNSVRIGSDSLAITKPNVVTAFNFAPVHERAGQLVLIKQWMVVNVEWLELLGAFSDCKRIFRSRLITDVISFCDCLVTRKVTAGAFQEMDGLNTLLEKCGEPSKVLNKFVSAFKIEEESENLRKLRNIFGGHLDEDPVRSLVSIISMIDSFDYQYVMNFYQRIKGAFDGTCREILFLRGYLADGAKLTGVKAASNPFPSVPFDESNPATAPLPFVQPDWNDPVDLDKNLEDWLTNLDGHEARSFFWDASLHSKEVETLTETEVIGSSRKLHPHKFRKCHQFLLDKLIAENDKQRAIKMLELMIACKNSDPYSYAEIVARYSDQAQRPVDDNCIATVLGHLASRFHGSAMKQIDAFSSSQDSTIRLNAVIARHKILVRSENLNGKNIILSYDNDIVPYLSSVSQENKLLLVIIFASQFTKSLGVYAEKLNDHYMFLKQEVENQTSALVGAKSFALIAVDIKNLLSAHDYTGIALHLSCYFEQADKPKTAKAFLSAAVGNIVEVRECLQSDMNYTACLMKNGNFMEAMEAAQNLANINPDKIDVQLFEVEIIGSCPGQKNAALARLEQIASTYNLDDESTKRVVALRKALTTKRNLKKKPKKRKNGKVPTRKRRL